MRRLGLILCSAFIILFSGSAIAGPAPPPGITISPAYQNIDILPGQSQQPVNFSVTNNEPGPQKLELKTADFNALDYTGGLFFVGSNASQLKKEYGLAKWLVLSNNEVTVSPHQTAKITVTIDNRQDLAPGGHYGALLLYISRGNSSSKVNSVGISPVASSLMFVTKLNGATYKMSLNKVSFSHSAFILPASVTLRFYNSGNTQLTPRGFVTLSDPGGHLVSKGVINENSGLILPQNYRDFSVQLNSTAISKLIGNYRLDVYYRFDGYSKFRHYEASVFLATPGLIIFILGIVAILAIAAFTMRRHIKALFDTYSKKKAKTMSKKPNQQAASKQLKGTIDITQKKGKAKATDKQRLAKTTPKKSKSINVKVDDD